MPNLLLYFYEIFSFTFHFQLYFSFSALLFIFSFFLIPKAHSYTCQTDDNCLTMLHEEFLNRDSKKSIYKYCEISLENSGFCCANPLECQESSFRQSAQTLRDESLNFVQKSQGGLISCQPQQLSLLSGVMSGLQIEFCNLAEDICKEDCKFKLDEFKDFFKGCFKIPRSLSINEVLEKAKDSTENQDCYNQMKVVADKYKFQSLEGKAVLKEKLKVEDIVDCREVKKKKTRANLMKLAGDTCQIAVKEKQGIEEEDRRRGEKTESERGSKKSKSGSGEVEKREGV